MYVHPLLTAPDALPSRMSTNHIRRGPAAALNIVENFMNIAYLYLAHVSGSPAAPLVGFASAVMTLSKTVLYWLQEFYCGGCAVGHNDLKTLIVYWIIPNGCVARVPGRVLPTRSLTGAPSTLCRHYQALARRAELYHLAAHKGHYRDAPRRRQGRGEGRVWQETVVAPRPLYCTTPPRSVFRTPHPSELRISIAANVLANLSRMFLGCTPPVGIYTIVLCARAPIG